MKFFYLLLLKTASAGVFGKIFDGMKDGIGKIGFGTTEEPKTAEQESMKCD